MTWLLDSRKLAKKVKNATTGSSFSAPANEQSQKNTICSECPTCGQSTEQTATLQEWPGLPAGVKFDPNDNELLDHLSAKIGCGSLRPHPLVDEFIPTLDGEDGICYTHPQKLPGIKTDGSSTHFFHRPANAYTTGTRKRRKIYMEDEQAKGETRWHKTGKTRPVLDNGEQIGCKKIMVLYTNFGRKSKPEKTNWVMHQYHLGTREEEKDGELVVSKVFYQTQPRQSCGVRKSSIANEEDCEGNEEIAAPLSAHPQQWASVSALTESSISRVTPATPQADSQVRSKKGKLSKIKGFCRGQVEKDSYSPTTELLDVAQRDAADGCSPVSHWVAPSNSSQRQMQNEVERENEHAISPLTLAGISASPLQPSLIGDSSWIGESQERDDMLGFDAELMDLFCDEKLYADPIFYDTSVDDVAQNFRSYAADIGLLLDEDSGDSSGELAENPSNEPTPDPALEEIILDTPPDFVEDLVLTSQELVDWIGKRRFVSGSERENSSDNDRSIKFFGDSQSST
ncbi:hypothetical protein O6H91_18G058000 [Diphasiastrum complanatum]|uniref:Uncharacterized protein n=5 Tax=Diphasiastrum complanatum TaxID=34168 RepID=A0ACC2B1N5_DIPCM|nr:hypothetical protein O6H91_18G058000 [Diphasiastrum complanatum]KAJ7523673.1 hypothetical protein O6H91_18G058000 [Diphasiastrum complanatum]KAJ7523676.1 hypothetical protein O6H91_18G058000 [Diphasiastrum complanatum]KAJ7523677.1 hypothetical protein O6H91_18G058000 [Diphasiastrum complanatum]KAJ7523678.1 hypothetical protein O6H91_18G058000 [Diphasiastrum complanatum]